MLLFLHQQLYNPWTSDSQVAPHFNAETFHSRAPERIFELERSGLQLEQSCCVSVKLKQGSSRRELGLKCSSWAAAIAIAGGEWLLQPG